ncbi:WSC domain-containing protein like [Verticillium longisporum]|uniref:WSC domain-containing protein like n=1 Tax=Verticillium longisporum TaxID=100787 RepID=A0A8I2ZFK6_VERLO|nr:WSC domain-containing protein like [Verticillium longisporum]
MKLQAALLVAVLGLTTADPTWPADTDELEEIMFQTTSTRSRKFADSVSPCTNQASGPGRHNAAEWLRTAFHDMATANTARGIGGIDASLQYELNNGENTGPGFGTTLTFMSPYMTKKSSMADLIALGVYISVRACGGPAVPFRAGRRDATTAGPVGVPQPQNAISIFRTQFDRMGFSPQEMIQVTACGHTIGGVHSAEFPDIIPAGTATNGQIALDSSVAVFDNKIVTEYLDGTTQNPLVVGRAIGLNKHSDFKVYNSDRNVTMQAMASAAAFNDVCKTVLQKMIDVVPPSVILTAPLEPYQVKPVGLQLTLSTQGTVIELTGFIRIRTTNAPLTSIAGLTIDYKARNGDNDCGSSGCSFPLTVQGVGRGLDDSFAWFPIARNVPLASGISSFTVTVRRTDGTSTVYDNNGASYPIQDAVFLQRYQSCLLQSSGVTTLTAAVRNDRAELPVRAIISYKTTQTGSVVPALNTLTLDLTRGPCIGPYTLFSVSTTIPGGRSVEATFDILSGDRVDAFKKANILGGTCQSRPVSNVCSTPAITSAVPSATSTTMTTISSPTPSIYRRQTMGPYTLVSCWSEPPAARALTGASFAYDGMTLESCLSNCTGFNYWGTEYGRECYCGDALHSGSAAAPLADCGMPCSGDGTQYCGGGNRIELYRTTATKTSTSTTAAAGPTRVPSVGGFVRVGCQTDNTGARALSGATTAGDDMTLDKCAAFCSAFTYFGTEYGRECWCGNALDSLSSPAPVEECNMRCAGNPLQFCGDGNRLELYRASAASSATLASSTTATTGGAESSVRLSEATSSAAPPSSLLSSSGRAVSSPSASSSSTPSPTGPAPVPTVSPFTLVGCQTEATSVPRALSAKSTTSNSMTLADCAAFCTGYRYFGTEYAAECYCGNSLHASSSVAPLDDCAMPCAGDPLTHCGGPNRLTLYEDPARASTPPREPRRPAFAGDFVWFGCRTEPTGARALSGKERAADDMANESCAAFCEGFAMFGTEYGRECFCGDELHAGAAGAPEEQCSMLCAGADDEFCGNGNRLSVYVRQEDEA